MIFISRQNILLQNVLLDGKYKMGTPFGRLTIFLHRSLGLIKNKSKPNYFFLKIVRCCIRDDESIKSVTNYINPWEHHKQREMFSKRKLQNMMKTEDRTECQKRVLRLLPGRSHKTITKKADLGKRGQQYKKKMKWKGNFRKTKSFLKSTFRKKIRPNKISLILLIFYTSIFNLLHVGIMCALYRRRRRL